MERNWVSLGCHWALLSAPCVLGGPVSFTISWKNLWISAISFCTFSLLLVVHQRERLASILWSFISISAEISLIIDALVRNTKLRYLDITHPATYSGTCPQRDSCQLWNTSLIPQVKAKIRQRCPVGSQFECLLECYVTKWCLQRIFRPMIAFS